MREPRPGDRVSVVVVWDTEMGDEYPDFRSGPLPAETGTVVESVEDADTETEGSELDEPVLLVCQDDSETIMKLSAALGHGLYRYGPVYGGYHALVLVEVVGPLDQTGEYIQAGDSVSYEGEPATFLGGVGADQGRISSPDADDEDVRVVSLDELTYDRGY